MGKHFQLSTTSLKETSSQIALTCALFAYYAQFGDIKYNSALSEQEQLTETLRVKTYLQAIISGVVDQQSRQKLGWFELIPPEDQAQQVLQHSNTDDPTTQLTTASVIDLAATNTDSLSDNHNKANNYFSCIKHQLCKLNQFNRQNELQHLNNKAIRELRSFFDNFKLANGQHAKELNEYNGDKACPVSNRRIAAIAGVSVFAGSNIAYIVTDFDELAFLIDNDLYFGEQDKALTTEYIGDSILAMTLGAVISYLIFANFKRDDKQNRATQVVAQICRTTTLGLTRVTKRKLAPRVTDNPDINNLTQQYQLPTSEQRQTLKKLNRGFNIEAIKANISAQGSKWRQRVTIGCKLAFATVLYTIDLTTLGLSLKARILIAVAVGTVSGMARYYAKLEYNKKKLWCRKWRPDTDFTFKNRYQSELAVFGLQPTDSSILASPDLADEQRQVEVDVESFIATHSQTENIPRHNPQKQNQSDYLKQLKQFAKSNLTGEYEKYLGYEKYFVAEFIFQMRVRELNQNEEEVNAERQVLFSSHLTKLVGREDAKSISRNHQYKTIAFYKKFQDSQAAEITEHPIAEIDSAIELVGDKPEQVYLADEPEVHRKMLQQSDWLNSAKHYLAPSLNLNNTAPDIDYIKQHLRHTFGFHNYKRKRLGVMPWQKVSEQAEQRAIDAYYQKKYMQAERDIATEQTPKKRRYNFDALLSSSENYFEKDIVEVKVCGERYQIEQREVLKEIYSHFPSPAISTVFFPPKEITAEVIKKNLQYSHRFLHFQHQQLQENTAYYKHFNKEQRIHHYFQYQYEQALKNIIIRKAGKTTEYFKSSERLFRELLRDEKLKEKHKINMAGTLESSIISGMKNTVLSFLPFMPELFFCGQQIGNAIANFATKCVIGTSVSSFFVYNAAKTNRRIKNNMRSTLSEREARLEQQRLIQELCALPGAK